VDSVFSSSGSHCPVCVEPHESEIEAPSDQARQGVGRESELSRRDLIEKPLSTFTFWSDQSDRNPSNSPSGFPEYRSKVRR
jgi:hypothetical protein